MVGVDVDQVRTDRHERGDHADSKYRGAEDGNDPLGVLVRRPAVPEEADGDEDGRSEERRKSVLWLHLPTSGFALEQLVGDDAENHHACEHPHSNADIGQADGSLGEVVIGLEDFVDGGEEEVEITAKP